PASPVPTTSLFFLLFPHPPRSTLFPYTTLFRSAPREPPSSGPFRCPSVVCPGASIGAQLPIRPHFTRRRAMPKRQGFIISGAGRSEEHTSELQSRGHLVCRLLLEKKKRQEEKND